MNLFCIYLLTLYGICTILAAAAGISCESAKNITLTCLMGEVEQLYMKSAAIEGDGQTPCETSLISEQTCELCRTLNESRGCLDILLDSCEYGEIHEFIWDAKVPYLGTVASLCNFGDVINEIHNNKECYTGITSNLRKCFNKLDMEPSCRAANKGYACSMKMAEAYCGSLFNKSGNHKLITEVFLRVLEPMIDLRNCSHESELYIAQIYPKFQYVWKKSTTTMRIKSSRERSVYFGLTYLYYNSSSRTVNINIATVPLCLLITSLSQKLSR